MLASVFLGLSLGLMNPVNADDAPSAVPCDLPWRDSRDISRRAVQSAASGISSKGRQTIVLYNGDQALWDALVEGGCRSLSKSKSKLNGVILASGDQQEVAFYTNGQLVATILNPNAAELAGDVIEVLAKYLHRAEGQ